jgi:PIN domain nuclease of toxin-antitoxin system
MTERFLLDTCTVIWFVEGRPLVQDATAALSRCRSDESKAYISSMSAWEVGMLISKGRLPTSKSAIAWFEDARGAVAAEVVYPSLAILIASSFLPQPIHNDPTDRILVATARKHDLTIITRDRAILAYGAAGHVRTLAC